MQKKVQRPIPKMQILLISIIISLFIYLGIYIIKPAEKEDNIKPYEEMLEKRQKPVTKQTETIEFLSNKPYYRYSNTSTQQQLQEQPQTQINKKEEYNSVLNRIKNYPIQSTYSLQNILDELLKAKGYPVGFIKIKETNINKQAKLHGDYNFAKFDYTDGKLFVNRLNTETKTEQVIANFAYELNYFDNLAKICKSIGINNFVQLFQDNNIPIDPMFWNKTIVYNTDTNSLSESYTSALKGVLSSDNSQTTSPYMQLKTITERMNNLLEQSAYQESDSVYKLYGMPQYNGKYRTISSKFNEINAKLDKLILSYYSLNLQKEVLFNYLYQQSAKANSYKLNYDNDQEYKSLLTNLDNINLKVSDKLSNTDIIELLEYKINNSSQEIVSKVQGQELKNTILEYLKYIKEEKVSAPKKELKYLIMLICIENDLKKTSENTELSLYYINVPEKYKEIYGITNKNQKFNPIYENSEFISKQGDKKKSDTLIQMLNDSRLNIKY